MRIVRGDAVGELVEIGFAENDRASGLELCDDVRVTIWNEVLQKLCAGGGANSGGMDIVFQRNGNSMKRTAIATRFAAGRRQFRFGFFGLVQSKFRRDGEIGVQFGIVAVNAREEMFGQLYGREFSRAEQSCQFSDG